VIDFSGYTAKYIEQQMLNQVSDTIDTREGSMIQTAVGPVAWYLEGLYLLLSQMQDNAYADTAVGGFLDLITQERNIFRTSAVAAVRKATFNVPVNSGSRFKTINGADSVIFISGPLLSSEADVYTYEMKCLTPGVIGNGYVGNLIPITAVPNLSSAILEDILIAGAEEETDDSLRARYFETFRVPAFGGNIQAYRNAILGIAGVGAVQVYPAWKGGGTVLCSILGSDLKPALSATIQAVQNAICPSENGETVPSANGYGMAPIGAAVTITTASPLTLNIRCNIEFVSGTQNGVEAYQVQIEEKIKEYLNSVTQTWGNALTGHKVEYAVTIYLSRIIYAILTIPTIVNVTGILVNGSGEDIHLVEMAHLQQIPELGTVVINGE
jgi:uncharacterized phage protein gp47/JayE